MARGCIAWACGIAAAWLAGAPLAAAAPRRPRAAVEPPVVVAGAPPRSHRALAWVRGALDRAGLAGWTALYDRDTDVPVRLWGPGQPAPGVMARPDVAEAWARSFLAAHIATLAPGASASDFVVVTNQLSPRGDLRSVGFAQRAGGFAVLGGAINLAFKNDRMIMAGSTALPHVAVALARQPPGGRPRLTAERVTSAAAAWLIAAGHRVAARGKPAAELVIVPIVRRRGPAGSDITYTLAEQVAMETTTGEPARWNVFVDAVTGAAVARESTLVFESGRVLYDAPVRGPASPAGRRARPAEHAFHVIDGAGATSDGDGMVAWPGPGNASLIPGLVGPLVRVTNKTGSLISDTLALSPGGTVTWSRASDPDGDAQIAAFVFASQAKQFARRYLNPELRYLDRQLSVTVNETVGVCNAYSTGDDLHFFAHTPGQCENSARIADIVYHEFGHSLHRQSIIPGVGQFDGAMSEGAADTFAAAITGDPEVARGFLLGDQPLRDLAAAVKKRWPEDLIDEVHADGEIYGQAMWDLRTRLEARLGKAAGFAHFLALFYATLQRAVDIPSSFAEVLVADDDDGDLGNGTPNECDIIAAFLAHGLFDPDVAGGLAPPTRDGFAIALRVPAASSARCQAPVVQSAELTWRLRGAATSRLPLISDGTALRATIPRQPDGSTLEYSVTATLSGGMTQTFPNNRAEPYYQFHVGPVVRLWCAGFEDGAPGWSHTASPPDRDRWAIGAPRGLAGDPAAAHAGTSVLGLALDGDGSYPAGTITEAVSPVIPVAGHRSVHLQYYRWLGVEDGAYDRATIRANDTVVWRNLANAVPALVVASHIDREWQFHDIDLSAQAAQAASGAIQLAFGLDSDAGVQAGGWNLDDVCLVATGPGCGNGALEAGEACDDGNASDGDGCESSCQPTASAGCRAGGAPAGPAGLAGLVLAAVAWRRTTGRRRRR